MNGYKEFIKKKYNTTIYFRFINTNKLHIEIYDNENELFSIINIEYGDKNGIIKVEDTIEDVPKNLQIIQQNIINIINKFNLSILITVLWYIATSSTRTKYIYEIPKVKNTDINLNKHIINVKDTKILTGTIYDLRKVKNVNTNVLNKRKEGWSYSHSFEVHGHYRHYKSGKVIFINPFIKGKNKPLKNQSIILQPKEGDNEMYSM